MRITSCRLIKAITNLSEQRAIRVEFKDGSSGLFPYVWLRDCSLDQKTYTISDAMKGRLHTMRDFDIRVEPLEVRFDEKANNLMIEWPGEVRSCFEQWWLKTRCPGDALVRARRREVYLGQECVRPWDRQEIQHRLRRFAHDAVIQDEKVLHDFLMSVCVDGIALIEGADQSKGDDAIREIVDRIGMLQRNHFGDIFEVYPKPGASNMAYVSSMELPYHTDFPSLQDPPHLQMLHMRRKAECGGGKSMFVDGFHVAKIMAQQHPQHFQLLCTIPLEFIEEGVDTHQLMDGTVERFEYAMMGRHKTFKLDEHGRVVQVQFGNVMRSWFIDIADPLLVQRVYDALKIFTELCYAPENQLIFPLNNGDTVLWANTRLLHARSAYRLIGRQQPERERRVLGCYFGWDIVKSRVRVLQKRLNLPQSQPTL